MSAGAGVVGAGGGGGGGGGDATGAVQVKLVPSVAVGVHPEALQECTHQE